MDLNGKSHKVIPAEVDVVAPVRRVHSLADMVPGTYVACIYDNYWWIGNIRNVCEEEDDVEITFMHPHGPSESFKWPRREDNCCVPIIHIICIIDDRSSNYINWETVQT